MSTSEKMFTHNNSLYSLLNNTNRKTLSIQHSVIQGHDYWCQQKSRVKKLVMAAWSTKDRIIVALFILTQ